METTTKKLYEAMFLVDSAQAGSDWDGTMAAINRVLERADAEVVTVRKWADRKLAYEIDHKTRGTYILCFFKADPSMISGIEKDVQLSEQIMRVLVTSTDGRSEEVLEKDIKGESPAPSDQEHDGPRSREDSRKVRSVSKTEAEEVKAAAAKQETKTEEKAAETTDAPAAEESTTTETTETTPADAEATEVKDESVPATETPEEPSGDTDTAEETSAS